MKTSFYLLSSSKYSKKLSRRIFDYKLEMASKGISDNVPSIVDSFIDRLKLEDLLKRRFFYDQSFAIYKGIAGLYDYGPMGCAIKTNMIQAWRRHFVIEEGMLEVECTALTPREVLVSSGHVERFIDWMVKDKVNGTCYRADHLIKKEADKILQDKKASSDLKKEMEEIISRIDGLTCDDMNAIIQKHDFKSQDGNNLSSPIAFNLMFPTSIGPTGDVQAYLRPETAQGIFINFKRLLEFNQGKLPFAAAQIGSGFRNEISPRQGLIRVREFTMCEIEHFVDPSDKSHLKFARVADLEMTLYSACDQVDGKQPSRMRIGEAVDNKTVNNETLGYYMARTQLYLLSMGIDPEKLRFRQHLSNEMAHYAQDCWDAECFTSYGWIECVGNADRACYDLTQHSKATRTKLAAEKLLPTPKKVQVIEIVPNKQALGKQFKSQSKQILGFLESRVEEEIVEIEKILKNKGSFTVDVDGEGIQLNNEFMQIKRSDKTIHIEDIVPSVVEPSFGIGRIMYSVLEHSFRQRDGDEKRSYLELVPLIAPIKCSILPISSNDRLDPIVKFIHEQLTELGISSKIDDGSGSIGRRYARTDEIGIPFGITVDFESESQPWTVTLRHTPTMKQVRMQVSEVGVILEKLITGKTTWNSVMEKYPIFVSGAQN